MHKAICILFSVGCVCILCSFSITIFFFLVTDLQELFCIRGKCIYHKQCKSFLQFVIFFDLLLLVFTIEKSEVLM